MEEENHQVEDARAAIPTSQSEGLSLELIRTETVLSRLPVHNLAKQGRVNIQIIKTTPTGEVELKWEVSYSDRYGQARQLAYKLDTIVINQRIDEAGRPLPKVLRIGSLNEICAELNLATHAGQNAKDLKRAFLQNASAFITAKFSYRANDNTERHVEAGVTRYGVIFTGEKLPDGRRADAVYITFNDPFWEVLNNAPVRPLDRAYMKQLPPAAQRFYEIISRKIFAALKNNYPRAKISYSEYCTFSAQLRHAERQRVQDQMAKVLRPHKTSGYITAVKYKPAIDAQNLPDWIMYLTPGPRAHAEFAAAHGRRKILKPVDSVLVEKVDRRLVRRPFAPKSDLPRIESTDARSAVDAQLVTEFTRRGITEQRARLLLANVEPHRDVLAQLEQIDQMMQHAGFHIENPAGFVIRMFEKNIPIPEGFESSAKRKAREEQERHEKAERDAIEARQQLEDDYENYRDSEIDRYIAVNREAFEALKDAKWQEDRARFTFTTESMARIAARNEIRKQLSFLTFEEFLTRKRDGHDFSLKPVGVSPAADGADLPTTPAVAEAPVGADAAVEAEPIAAVPEEEPTAERATIPSIDPVMPGPLMIELASEPPHSEPGGTAAEQGIA